MNAVVAQFGALFAVLAALTYFVLRDLVRDELRARVSRLPFAILWMASRRLPPELRAEIYDQEWLPELCYLMESDRFGPVTRLFRATRFALSVWMRRGGERTARELAVCSPPPAGFVELRTLSRVRRKEFTELTRRLCELLGGHVGSRDPYWAARVLTVTAVACEAHIANRDERTAESLAQAAFRLVGWLDPDDPVVHRVRRALAYALLQLGHNQRATSLLRAVSADETRIFGAHHPDTFPTRRLLNWALVCTGRFPQAEAGFRALDASMARLPRADPSLRLHIQCMLSWTIAQQGRLPEAEDNYDTVIASRSYRLGPLHPDTLDTQHSKGKMLVLFGHGPRARAVLRTLLADRRRIQGRRHPDTLETRKYLAVATALSRPHHVHSRRKTVRELQRILRLQNTTHGPEHPNTRDTRQWLAAFTGPTETPHTPPAAHQPNLE